MVLYGIAVLHVQIDQISKLASSFFLPLSTATLELGTVASATALYNHRVFKRRDAEPRCREVETSLCLARAIACSGCVSLPETEDQPTWGDQAKSTLPVVPVAIHAFTETCRLVLGSSI